MLLKLTQYGHDRDTVLYRYSLPEVQLYYEKILEEELRKRADFIEDVVAGIGGALGGKKAFQSLRPMLDEMRKGTGEVKNHGRKSH